MMILTEVKGSVATLTFNRTEVHNAFNIGFIRQLASSFGEVNSNARIRIIIFRANGSHFSSGADLNWMKAGLSQSPEQLLNESRELAELYAIIDNSKKVTISLVHGKVIGGANGIVAASDITLAEETAQFAFTEVKLGLIPATISPYVVRKMGRSHAMELMMTGRFFSAGEASDKGLVHRVVKESRLHQAEEELVQNLLSNAPGALSGIKDLMRLENLEQGGPAIQEHTARLIASFRVSGEGQEGMLSFLEKRKPGWYEER